MMKATLSLLLAASLVATSTAFLSPPTHNSNNNMVQSSCQPLSMSSKDEQNQGTGGGGPFQALSNFWNELDAFMDDASARRLGNGAAFYGKRKSNFYGTQDSQRKADRNTPDPTEDYQGPDIGGLFKWMPDESGQMRPVTRMKNKNIERKPSYWDRVYSDDE